MGFHQDISYARRMEINLDNKLRMEIMISSLLTRINEGGDLGKIINDTLKRTVEILRVDKEEEVSLLVIGSHGKSNLDEIFLGSVSEKVARKCKSPVLIVKR